MPFLALQYIYTSTCTEPDTHALIKKLINLVSQFNKHLIINCFRFNYFCPNILKIYILSGFLQIYITFYGFFSKRITVNALFKVVLYIVERFDSLDYGRLYYSQHYTPRDYTNLVLSSLLLLYCICYSCQIYQSGTDYVCIGQAFCFY